MKQIDNYIVEKLHLDKKTKINKLDRIITSLQFNKDHAQLLKKWIKNNNINISDIVIYCRTSIDSPKDPEILEKHGFDSSYDFEFNEDKISKYVEIFNNPLDRNIYYVSKEWKIYTHKQFKNVMLIIYKKNISESKDFIYFVIEAKK